MKERLGKIIQKSYGFLKIHSSRKHENFPFYLLIFIAFVVGLLALNIFVELTDEIAENSLKIYDERITNFILSYRTPALTDFFRVITDLGDFYAYVAATIFAAVFLFLKFKHWKFILQLLAIIVLSALSNVAIKRFIGRARPGIEHLVTVETLSYPSGHAMCAMAFYGFLSYLSFKINMSKWVRGLLCSLFFFLILLIGISRIYLGVHFPSDVAGGYLAGLIWLAFCIVLFNVFHLYQKKKTRKDPSEKEGNLKI